MAFSSWARALLAVAVAFTLGCPSSGPTLTLDVRTDYAPGVEFDQVRVRLDENAAPIARAIRSDDYVRGQRVAEFRDLTPGVHRLHAELIDGSELVGERHALLSLTASRVVVFTVTRDCEGVTCPLPSGNPSFDACLGGRCVDPTCLDDDPDPALCGVPECVTAAECTSTFECVRGECLDGVCLLVGDGERCAEGEWCDPEGGCQPLGAPRADAGAPDASEVEPPDAALEDLPDASELPTEDAGAPPIDAYPIVFSSSRAISPEGVLITKRTSPLRM